MPDIPASSSLVSTSASSVAAIPIVQKTHSLTTSTFTKINLLGGPFNVKLCHNTNPTDNYKSVDIVAEESLHQLISINIEQNAALTIRVTENINTSNKTNITIFIIFKQLNELYIDGMINVQCDNRIETNRLLVNHRGTGSMKLKLNVNALEADLYSIGHVKLCGQVYGEAIIKSLGVGDVDGRNLLTKTIQVISSGIGNLYVMAIDEINITLSGIGTVYYAGPIKRQVKTGLGNIIAVPPVSFYDDE
ncbi:unnamed protein product [Rotaria socialis]|nr:unnamed protein product [Rotaria socialis]